MHSETSHQEGASPPDLQDLPVRLTRKQAAKLVSHHYFEVSPRSLERWPISWRWINGRAHCLTTDLLVLAQSKLDAVPSVMGGRRSSNRRVV
jgi:hypothetical protein